MPWNTVVLTWTDVTMPVESEVFKSTLAQRVELKWGRLQSVINIEDAQLLAIRSTVDRSVQVRNLPRLLYLRKPRLSTRVEACLHSLTFNRVSEMPRFL